jgi:hypothetical protein
MAGRRRHTDRPIDWLREGQRLVFPLPQGTAAVYVFRVIPGSYRVAFETAATAHGVLARELPADAVYPNEYSAVMQGLAAVRSIWARRGVPAMVSNVTAAMEGYWG